MKCVVNGRLAEPAKIEEVMMKNGPSAGQRIMKASFTIFSPDPNGPKQQITKEDGTKKEYTKGIALNCVTWGERASKVRDMEKGEIITGTATVRYGNYGSPQFVITKIDPENKIHKQMSSLITAYTDGAIDQFYENEEQRDPSFRENDIEAAMQYEQQQEQQTVIEREHEEERIMQ